MDIVLDKDLCLSGGALGSDLAFGKAALSANHSLIHWSFAKHKVIEQKEYVVVLPHSELIQAEPYLIKANEYMKRKYPSSNEHVNNLLRRNWFQVKDSSSCYAISEIKDGMVEGGTAWATTLFLLRFEYESCPCYVFCQTANIWFKWEGFWKPIETPPKPSDIYAGIGSRKLLSNGAEAIEKLFL